MADSKITALTAISTVDPTADPLVIVDVSDTSMAASGTTKKSTINQLLGAGGTATLASATITGDLTVDTSTLKVDSANNRVGVTTASPFCAFHTNNDGVASGAGWNVIGRFNNVANTKGLDLGYNPSNNNAIITALSGGTASGFEFWNFNSGWAARFAINPNGVAVLNGGNTAANGVGIAFPATQVASSDANTLDDYEEGTWTIGLTFGGGSTGITTSANTGRYTKVGRQVTVIGYLALTNKGSSTGSAVITGLPFTSPNSLDAFAAATLRFTAVSYTGTIQGIQLINSTKIELDNISDAGVVSSLTDSNFANSSSIMISCTYTV